MAGSALSRIKRADKLIAKFYPPRGPRQWSIVLEAGEPVPNEISSQFQKGDQVLIVEFPSGFDVTGPEDPVRCVATSWPLHGSPKDQRHNKTIVIETPRDKPLQTIEEAGFARRVSETYV